jgi:S-formylglutathione hydrolase FrmB
MKLYSFYVKLAFTLCILTDYTFGDAPNFVSVHGITVRSSVQLNNQLYEMSLVSNEVRGEQKLRIIVPRGYATSSNTRRYPVLYLLHGSFGGAADWTTVGKAQDICGNASLITVMPNGNPFGFYTNWVIPGHAAPQNWRTYHMEQLVPWIDFNLRTLSKKQGRAIAGFSMGGFGAIRYAEQYSNNFAYVAAFSGALDILDTRVQQIILDLSTMEKKPLLGPFGSPSAPVNSNEWFAQNPINHAASLRTIAIALYTGDADDLEITLRDSNNRMRDALNSLDIPLYFNDYGNGQSIGYGCNGGHTWPCWNAALMDVLPRMMAVLQQQY